MMEHRLYMKLQGGCGEFDLLLNGLPVVACGNSEGFSQGSEQSMLLIDGIRRVIYCWPARWLFTIMRLSEQVIQSEKT
jgi:hypothetical protein